MSAQKKFMNQQHGFSMVEIMVGMVISLLSMIIILQVFTTFEGQKRTSTSGSNAQTNGSIALFTIERSLRNAGYGFSVPEALGCKINKSFNGVSSFFSLQPVTIINGAGGTPDTITILSSGKDGWSIPSTIITDHPASAANFKVSSILGMEVNDLMIAFQPGKDCTLFQIKNIPASDMQIQHLPTSPYNPPGGQNIYPPGGYNIGAQLFNLGQMVQQTYSLSNVNNDLLVTDFVTATGVASAAVSLTPDIVNLQAKYGFDTRAGPQTDARVGRWDDAMFDADNDGVTGNGGDIARIYAIKLVVVARSGQQEKADAAGVCNTTPAPPTWDRGTNGIPVNIDVSRNPDGSANANWRCFRYKTFETVIPLRNLIWRQT